MFDRFFPSSQVVQAADTAEVAEAVAEAHRARRPIYPVGAGTSLALGAAIDEPGTILALGKLNQRIDYPSRDLTITVGAGTTMAELAGQIAAENQRFPVDAAYPEKATVGGVVVANLSGPRRHRFGTMRDYLLGLTGVDGTGKVFCAGGRVVKNAAGYDLTRLMIGSLGTLSVITQVTLMVRPLPAVSAFAVIPLPSLEKADSLLERLASCSMEPSAVELVAGPDIPETLRPGPEATLWIGLESSEIEVRWMFDTVATTCRQSGLEAAFVDEPNRVASLWQHLTEHAAAGQGDRCDSTLAVEVTVLPSRTIAAAARLQQIDSQVSLHGRAGCGVVLGQFSCPPDRAARLASEIRTAVAGMGGRTVVTAYPPESRLDRQTVWGMAGAEMRVMQRIKQQFDPQGILNPGRFIFERPPANASC